MRMFFLLLVRRDDDRALSTVDTVEVSSTPCLLHSPAASLVRTPPKL